MIIKNYFSKELSANFLGILIIFLIILIAHSCIKYLQYFLLGKFEFNDLLGLLLFELPYTLSLLLPFALFIAIIVVMNKMHKTNEIVTLAVAGYSRLHMIGLAKYMFLAITIIVLLLSFWVAPYTDYLLQNMKKQSSMNLFNKFVVPGEFMTFNNGNYLVYVAEKNADNIAFKPLIFYRAKGGGYKYNVLTAKQAAWNKETNNLELTSGYQYIFNKDLAQVIAMQFANNIIELPLLLSEYSYNMRAVSPVELINGVKAGSLDYIAELYLRCSKVLLVIITILLAFAISISAPRKYQAWPYILGICLYIAYFNLLFVSRNMLLVQSMSLFLGVIWLHLLFLGLTSIIYYFNNRT